MTYIDCCTPSLPAPLPPRGARVRRLNRRLAPVLAPALLVAALGCREEATSPSAPEPGPALDITPAQVLSFRQVSAGGFHTCGVTTGDQAYCWGRGTEGQLGDGTTTNRLTPVPVAGGLRFRQVRAGGDAHTCGLSLDNQAYCWGGNTFGRLGDGTTTNRLTPVPISGGLSFRQVDAGVFHTCGVTIENVAYCWGGGILGDRARTGSLTPVAVAGAHRFRQVSAGSTHTCGLNLLDRALCWGDNTFGKLGDGTTALRRQGPVRVVGGLQFGQLSAGGQHTCGVTTADRVFCWGGNEAGQLGDGTTTSPLTPVAVAGGRRFLRVSTGGDHTCAVNPLDVAFCWGENSRGQLGDNTTTPRLTPIRVVGGLRFREVSAGSFHTCGVTTGDRAYCWGSNNFFGQLGDGTLKNRRRPTAVVGAS
jgi:alpha-tubulin suppressor-like RCC1 family protein